MRLRVAVIGLIAISYSTVCAPGQTVAAPANPRELFRWTVSPSDTSVVAGDTLWVTSALTIAPEHYVYAERTSVAVGGPPGLWVGPVERAEPHLAYDEFEGRDVMKYYEEADFRAPVVAGPSLSGGTVSVEVTLGTQGCSKTMCYFPMTEKRAVGLTVISVAEPPALTDYTAPGTRPAESFAGPLDIGHVVAERGILLALGVMFVGGVLASFTPCVYPLIPITVSLFGASRNSALRGFLLSVVFVLGMAVMYSVLGVSAAATGAVFGSIMTNPVVIGVIALMFLVFAASMFGAFEVQLPSSLQLRLSRVGGVGFGGSFAAGLVAGVIAAPCTGPVLGAALTYVATTRDLTFGFVSMFSFALGMGLLFVVIGTLSTRAVPKSGPWLKKVEGVFGIAMVVAALYFLKEIVPSLKGLMRGSATALAVSLALVVIGLLLGAVHKRFVAWHDRQGNPEPTPSAVERTRKAVGVLMVVAGMYGVIGYILIPSRPSVATDAVSGAQPEWITDEARGLERARSESKPVLIDAYADWCVACKELDRYTYSDRRVLDRLSSFVAIKLDLTNPTPENDALVRKYAILGLPTVIVLDSRGEEMKERRVLGFVSAEDLLRKLEEVR